MKKTKRNLTIASIIIVIIIMLSQRNTKPSFNFPECEEEIIINSNITFYIDNNIDNKEELKRRLQEAVNMSNTILSNSCIPITRVFKESHSVSISHDRMSISSVHSDLKQAVGSSKINSFLDDPKEQYVLVLSDNHPLVIKEGINGMTMVNLNDSFVLLAESFPIAVLEHELGHLGWAMHERPNSESGDFWIIEQVFAKNRSKVKPYSGAFHCSNYGTVMSYSEKVVPAYSSPLVSNNGEPCGNEEYADNARVMREYAKTLQ
ncbi:hypothetical protein [Vibrio vulnificus]|uniref:hypothetical protein n=1 Tax=Vibrio vulnificus TaxID=672 RepID=UPI0009B7FAC9|nr:hypothetical protein [Vibrio vulnificus]HDY8226382.1 hypothetical protein [Vibrio vulnificus]HDY8230046.1 hypothetical protein [Vibrio vulnificus]